MLDHTLHFFLAFAINKKQWFASGDILSRIVASSGVI